MTRRGPSPRPMRGGRETRPPIGTALETPIRKPGGGRVDGSPFAALASWARSLSGTTYAVRFAEARFSAIKNGMSRGEVEKILGQPLAKHHWESGEDNWVYSESPIGWNHEIRWVLIEDGVVKTVVNQYWQEQERAPGNAPASPPDW